MYRPPGAADREFWLCFVGFLASKLVQMAPANPQDSFGPSFRPNGRFSPHLGPNLMFLALTGTLVSQDLGLACLWTSPIAAGKPDPLSETSTSVLSQQQTSVLSQQQTSVLSQQQTSVLSQQKTSVLSQQQILSASEICRGPDTSKWPDLDNRKVTFQTDGTPKSRIAVRFQ